MKFSKHILPLLCIAIVTVIISQQLYAGILVSEEDRCWQELETTVRDTSNEIAIKFTDEISKLHLIETIMVNDHMRSHTKVSNLYINELKDSTMFARIDILYPDNTIVSNGEVIEIDEDISFDRIKSKGEYMTDRKTDFLNSSPCVYYVLPVMVDGEVSAVLIGVIDLTTLTDLFRPVIYNGDANICMIDSNDGNYIMDSWHAELGNAFEMEERERVKGFENVSLKSEIKNRNTGSIAFVSKTTGNDIYMYYTPFEMFDWHIAVFAEKGVLFSNVSALRHKFIISGTVQVLLLIVYFAWNTQLIRKLQHSNDEIEKKNEQLDFLSYRDMLTSLYNRRKYTDTLNALRTEKPSNMGIAYVDLNGLKQMNDSRSHESGDEFIKSVARLLSKTFGECCYRIGGDEFVVICPDVEATDFARKIDSLKRSIDEEDISTSVGSIWKKDCDDLDGMLREAERRMYIEKHRYYRTRSEIVAGSFDN